MAIFNKFVVAACALATIVGAVPMNLRRDLSVVTETAYTTVDVNVQLVVDEDGTPIQTIVPSGMASVATTTTAAPAVATTTVATPSSVPTPTSQYVAPTPSTTMMTTVVPTSTQAAAVAPASSSTVAAAAPSATTGSSGSTGSSQIVASDTNSCLGPSDACSGDITHYDGGQSACGPIVDTNTQMAIALPWQFMGTESNDNPYCGKTLTIHNPTTGVEVQAYVADKCMGCTGRSIDLTDAVFNAIAPTCDGRCSGFEWWFN